VIPTFPPLPTVPGGFGAITCDWPWRFRDKGSRLAPDQGEKLARARGYETLEAARSVDLPVGDIAARDSFLFLWTTDSHLLDGSAGALARSWGFVPKRAWTWVKRTPPKADLRALLQDVHHLLTFADDERFADAARPMRKLIRDGLRVTKGEDQGGRLAFGGGHYVRTAHELVLICRRGRAKFLVHDERSVFFAARRKGGTGEVHSTKPVEFLAKVERVAPGPYLEMFARTSGRPGWRAWGDQLPGAGAGAGRAA
jgi:N6-adenosine-specific RNA methylase IME4